jgi:hypothetical protein
MWGVVHYFGQEGKGDQVSFTKNIMHYIREEMCYYNIEDPTSGKMLVPIASAIIMLLMAHSLLAGGCVDERFVEERFDRSLPVLVQEGWYRRGRQASARARLFRNRREDMDRDKGEEAAAAQPVLWHVEMPKSDQGANA